MEQVHTITAGPHAPAVDALACPSERPPMDEEIISFSSIGPLLEVMYSNHWAGGSGNTSECRRWCAVPGAAGSFRARHCHPLLQTGASAGLQHSLHFLTLVSRCRLARR